MNENAKATADYMPAPTGQKQVARNVMRHKKTT